jgi:hypothetical protein
MALLGRKTALRYICNFTELFAGYIDHQPLHSADESATRNRVCHRLIGSLAKYKVRLGIERLILLDNGQ